MLKMLTHAIGCAFCLRSSAINRISKFCIRKCAKAQLRCTRKPYSIGRCRWSCITFQQNTHLCRKWSSTTPKRRLIHPLFETQTKCKHFNPTHHLSFMLPAQKKKKCSECPPNTLTSPPTND